MEADRYVLATGRDGAPRLDVLHSIHSADTIWFLRSLGIKPGSRVLDAGCGTGNCSKELSLLVGSTGEVIALDKDPAQISTCMEQMRLLGLSNVKCVCGDLATISLPSAEFDVVYCRFVLGHCSNPAGLIDRLSSLMAPNGLLVMEEPEIASGTTVPYASAYHRAEELFLALGRVSGQDFEVGRNLYGLLRTQGLHVEAAKISQPLLIEENQRRIFEFGLLECAQRYIDEGLSSAGEIQDLVGQLRELACNSSVLMSTPRIFQFAARRAARQ